MDREHLVCLYCVTTAPFDLAWVGDQPGELYLVGAAGLCAVVARVETSQFGPSSLPRHLEDLDWVVAETTKHENIVEAVMRHRGVIPFRFATLFHTDESLQCQLQTRAAEFRMLLERLRDKAEWGVKVHCDVERLRSLVSAQDSAVAHLSESIRCASPGKAFFLEKKREDAAGVALAGRIDQCVGQMVETLQTASLQTRINKVGLPGVTSKHEAMILNAAFLVANPAAPTFVDLARALNERHADHGLSVECTGPWPPYNFCDSSGKVTNG